MKSHHSHRTEIARRIVAQFARRSRRFAGRTAFLGLLALGPFAASAGELSVAVVDTTGKRLPEAVVTVTPLDEKAPAARNSATAIMDQVQLAFVPRVLVVAVGTTVEFPNELVSRKTVFIFPQRRNFNCRSTRVSCILRWYSTTKALWSWDAIFTIRWWATSMSHRRPTSAKPTHRARCDWPISRRATTALSFGTR